MNWITGVVLFLLILGFSLSGYLLPWDQKAYWATVVTINVRRVPRCSARTWPTSCAADPNWAR